MKKHPKDSDTPSAAPAAEEISGWDAEMERVGTMETAEAAEMEADRDGGDIQLTDASANGAPPAAEEEVAGEDEGDWLDTDGMEDAADPIAGSVAGVRADDGSFLAQAQKKTFQYDFEGVEDGPPRLDPGFYHARLVDCDMEDAKSSGVPQFVWQFIVISGPKKNFKLKFWTSLSKDARWKAAQTMKALGVSAAGKVGTLDVDAIKGRPVRLEIIHEPYQGEMRSKVKTVHPPDAETLIAHQEATNLV